MQGVLMHPDLNQTYAPASLRPYAIQSTFADLLFKPALDKRTGVEPNAKSRTVQSEN